MPEDLYLRLVHRVQDTPMLARERPLHFYAADPVDRPTLEEIRAHRATLRVPPLTAEFLEAAIEAGRA